MKMINKLHLAMIELYRGDVKRIQHFCKVHSYAKRSVNADSVTRFLLLWIKSLTDCAIPFALCLTMSFPALLAEIG